MATTHLLYLHGFRSSPQSTKARRMAAWVRAQRPDLVWWCPQLPASPAQAIAVLLQGTAAWPRETMAAVGSSLGGFYATVLAERLGCRAVLLNPAVDPARDLAAHVGATTTWHSDEVFTFAPHFVDELRALRPAAITLPQRYFAVIAMGDEVLSWQEMNNRYAACQVKLLASSDHALTDFDNHLPDILHFLQLP